MKKFGIAIVVIVCVLAAAYLLLNQNSYTPSEDELSWAGPRATAHMTAEGGVQESGVALEGIDAYKPGTAYVTLNGNKPEFTSEQLRVNSGLEVYGELDGLDRCTFAYACVGDETMPEGERGDISEVHPSGWRHTEYDFIEGGVLFNRCHLIAHMLTAEDANERNLITGTRYLNTEGMQQFEEQVAQCVWRTDLHVAYRVTPVFDGRELVCRGVQLEAYSIEDGGRRLSFNVFCYNVQPGVEIDYRDGRSHEADNVAELGLDYDEAAETGEPATYVLNERTMKFHRIGCESVVDIWPEHRRDFTGQRSYLIEQGYSPCGACNP